MTHVAAGVFLFYTVRTIRDAVLGSCLDSVARARVRELKPSNFICVMKVIWVTICVMKVTRILICVAQVT